MKVLFLTNIPSPYRVDFFNELGKHCDLTVLFERATSNERKATWHNYEFANFNGIFLKGKSISTDVAICKDVKKYVCDKSYNHIICANFSSPTGIIAIYTMKRRHIPYYLEADGGTPGTGSGIKEYLKKIVMSNAKGYFSSGNMCDKYFLKYGATSEKLIRYNFTSLFNSDILKCPVSKDKKIALRNELKLAENRIIITVGRFSYKNGYGKGYDTLFKVCEDLDGDVGVYIIGDNPSNEFVKWKEQKKLYNIHFVPFQKKQELVKYYQAADLMVFLTRGEAWGLVVNEAMSNGLPVITTDVCVGGVELIRNGQNGYIVPANDATAAKEAVDKCFSHNEEDLAKNALDAIRPYTIENMAKTHMEVFERE